MIVLWVVAGLVFVTFGLIVLRGAPYVPTHRKQLARAFDELYPLTSHDVVADLGSGDGVVLLAAAERGAGAIGYELNPFLVWGSRWRLRRYKNTRVLTRDFMLLETLPPEVTVVYAFTTGHTIDGIARKVRQWSASRPLAFISYGFEASHEQPVRSLGPMHLYRFGGDESKTV